MPSQGSFTSKGLFSFIRNITKPNAGDLRDPISFFKSDRKPIIDADGVPGFSQGITPYHNAWSFAWQNQDAQLDGQNTENFISHVFLVRNFKGFQPETRDYILWSGSVLSVRGTRNIESDVQHGYIVVLAEQEGLFAEEQRDDPTLASTPEIDHDNPLWR